MAKDVVCSVDTCVYWRNGNKCNAEKIEIKNYSMDQAYKSDETLCETFKPNSGV